MPEDKRTRILDGSKIIRLRSAKGWTQERLASESGTSKKTIERAEAGEPVLLRTIGEMAASLHVTVQDLVDDSRAEASGVYPVGGARGALPPLPSLLVGREEVLVDLKSRLGVGGMGQQVERAQVLAAVRGWPGVGKTSVAAALTHDLDIDAAFPDGILWTSLGPEPHPLFHLAMWAAALGDEAISKALTAQEASARLAAKLKDKRILFVIDDVWKASDAALLRVGGARCATLITTRAMDVARALAPTASDIYLLDVLTDEHGLDLLGRLAPRVIESHRADALELVRALEGLPLALQVAGRLLDAEMHPGWGVTDLLRELRQDATRLLEISAPVETAESWEQHATPTVAALLRKSTSVLDPATRDRFALLGAFAAKPATFDLEAMAAVWEVRDPKPTVRILIDRGLLEPVMNHRLQMHALLALHARTLLSP